MKYNEFKKQQSLHIRCAVCGKTFKSYYDERLEAHPVYHPLQSNMKEYESCEHRFYKSLLRIYLFLNHTPNSVPMGVLLNDFDWLGNMLMKKEMISWCLGRGYLALDNLSRIKLPGEIEDPLKEIFSRYKLEDDESVTEAIEMLKAALRCFKDELTPVDPAEAYANVAAQQEVIKRDAPTEEAPKKAVSRMHTTEHLGKWDR